MTELVGKWEQATAEPPRRARIRLSGTHRDAVELIAVSVADTDARARRRRIVADGFVEELTGDA